MSADKNHVVVTIADVTVSARICELVQNQSGALDASVADVKACCSTEEFEAYRQAIGQIMGRMYLSVLEPLWTQHPSTAPVWFKELQRKHGKAP